MEWTDEKKRLPDDGGIALQVHGGAPDRFFGKTVRYRNIRVKVLGLMSQRRCNLRTVARRNATKSNRHHAFGPGPLQWKEVGLYLS